MSGLWQKRLQGPDHCYIIKKIGGKHSHILGWAGSRGTQQHCNITGLQNRKCLSSLDDGSIATCKGMIYSIIKTCVLLIGSTHGVAAIIFR